jgi:hypothetical protein
VMRIPPRVIVSAFEVQASAQGNPRNLDQMARSGRLDACSASRCTSAIARFRELQA